MAFMHTDTDASQRCQSALSTKFHCAQCAKVLSFQQKLWWDQNKIETQCAWICCILTLFQSSPPVLWHSYEKEQKLSPSPGDRYYTPHWLNFHMIVATKIILHCAQSTRCKWIGNKLVLIYYYIQVIWDRISNCSWEVKGQQDFWTPRYKP